MKRLSQKDNLSFFVQRHGCSVSPKKGGPGGRTYFFALSQFWKCLYYSNKLLGLTFQSVSCYIETPRVFCSCPSSVKEHRLRLRNRTTIPTFGLKFFQPFVCHAVFLVFRKTELKQSIESVALNIVKVQKVYRSFYHLFLTRCVDLISLVMRKYFE
jgi:hypothetical protein